MRDIGFHEDFLRSSLLRLKLYSSGGNILTYSTVHGTNVQLNFFFTIPDAEHYLNLQTTV